MFFYTSAFGKEVATSASAYFYILSLKGKMMKKEIETNEDCGLDFINDFRTVTFKWRPPSEYDESVPTRDEDKTEPKHKDKMYGFIAQEVKSSLDKFNIKDFNGLATAISCQVNLNKLIYLIK